MTIAQTNLVIEFNVLKVPLLFNLIKSITDYYLTRNYFALNATIVLSGMFFFLNKVIDSNG